MTTTYWFPKVVLGNESNLSLSIVSSGLVVGGSFWCPALVLFARMRAHLRYSVTVVYISSLSWGHYTSCRVVLYMLRPAGLPAGPGNDNCIIGALENIAEHLLVLLHKSCRCGLWRTLLLCEQLEPSVPAADENCDMTTLWHCLRENRLLERK